MKANTQPDRQQPAPQIRPARPEDADSIVPLLVQAIDDIAYSLAGEADHERTLDILRDFVIQENNRISHQNIMVMELDEQIAGMLVAYAGDDADQLDQPIIDRPGRDQDERYVLVKETRPGEYYLDTLSVSESFQGRGIGRALMAAFEQHARRLGHTRTALIVEQDNERARRLYERQGYIQDDVLLIGGHEYYHMIKSISDL
ncbi:Mycothiol acetyltransferase [Paenibacillus sp. JJ-100]|uniref:GNAT family N-acetyltransferase n=1 Tax=Paenibacillus sp. JJ-100 TaxID=2974896 RepID=UPI0022FF9964|nr:GNAT family N-acetyltransferase [Paenibacillus sp. JJ-100]CAI6085416.1 Mycothiol acetyltransferase [Paenibacillus sp. JJ-100]